MCTSPHTNTHSISNTNLLLWTAIDGPALQSMGLQTAGHDSATEHNWTSTSWFFPLKDQSSKYFWFPEEARPRPGLLHLWQLFKKKKLFLWLCWVLAAACGIQFPDQRSNPGPLHWKHGVLATGPPGKSLNYLINVLYLPHILAYFLTTRLKISHIRKEFSTNCCSHQ